MEHRVTNEATGGQKGRKPEAYSLVPRAPLAEVARLYGVGAEKYERDNWRKGYAWSLSVDAMQRHLAAFLTGDFWDDETGCHHLASVVFHAFSLMEWTVTHPELDDVTPDDEEHAAPDVPLEELEAELLDPWGRWYRRTDEVGLAPELRKSLAELIGDGGGS